MRRTSPGCSAARLHGWSRQLEAITREAGPAMTRANADDVRLLRARFDADLNELRVRQTDRKDYAAPSLALIDAIFVQFLHLPAPGREDATRAELARAWADITARLAQGPACIRSGQALVTRPGRLFATVGAQQLAGMPDFQKGPLSDAAQAQLAEDPAALARFEAARDTLLNTLARTRAYVARHAARWHENHAIGREAYDQMLQQEQLLPCRATDSVSMGQDPLAHGWAEEAWLRALSVERRQAFGPDSGGGMASGGAALASYYRERIAQLRDFVEAHDIVTMPAWLGAMEVVQTPAFLQPVSPGASMQSPRLFDRSTTGCYFITPPAALDEAARRLDMNQDFDRDCILSTAAHEALPGHFLQLSIARRHADLVRRISYSAAFSEGWADYGEEMFVRLRL